MRCEGLPMDSTVDIVFKLTDVVTHELVLGAYLDGVAATRVL